VLLEEIDRPEQLIEVAERLLEQFAAPFVINSISHFVSLSIGITVYPYDGHNVETILQHADVAMSHAKERGRNNYQFFSKSMNNFLALRLQMENDLRSALDKNQFELFYQPQYDASNLAITGFEALLRWRHPTKGLLAPGSFMEIAESGGYIINIGNWVMYEACRQLDEWQKKSGCLYHVAINLSALQFSQSYLPKQLREVLEQTGIPAETLELEITETAMLNDIAETIPLLFAIKKTGVRLAIDDFGTGYSSMSYLKNFPLDVLKIDRSFVEEIDFNRKDAAIAQTIVQLAENLEITTVAEGVETEAQLKLLKQMGCAKFQGYYFSKPMPASDIERLIGIV
jgi:EAL domain-containing protein (putative c-di-GMP-specific phosphodiesterase class I)